MYKKIYREKYINLCVDDSYRAQMPETSNYFRGDEKPLELSHVAVDNDFRDGLFDNITSILLDEVDIARLPPSDA